MARNQKIIRYRRTFHFNIGFFIFLIIIVYVIFNIFSYMNKQTIAEYEVTQGTIATNNVYRGLILRNEEVYSADHTGYLNYYVKNAAKVASRDVVCSIDTDGYISKQITKAVEDGSSLETEDFTKISGKLSDFTTSYDSNHFSEVYGFKEDINSDIAQTLSTVALSAIADDVKLAKKNKTFYQQQSGQAGIVLYYTDGLESVTLDNYTADQVSGTKYKKTMLDNSEQVEAGNPIYKLVTSEVWNVVIAVSDQLAKELKDGDTVKVRFCKDGFTTNAGYSIVKNEGTFYLELTLTTAMIRYVSDRYTDVELILNAQEGLKIPNTAITSKDFFTIPKEYFADGNNQDEKGVFLQSYVDGKSTMEFVSPTIYFESDDYYYVDGEDLNSGDVITKSDSSDTYTVGKDVDSLEGVYNINKGYAVFKQINILYQNEEYSIVETKTNYGIALYDHIALDGSKIRENDFITK